MTEEQWNDYTDQLEGNRVVRKVKDWIPAGRRKMGGPKMMWQDMVKQEE
jgi:hypothetical protein